MSETSKEVWQDVSDFSKKSWDSISAWGEDAFNTAGVWTDKSIATSKEWLKAADKELNEMLNPKTAKEARSRAQYHGRHCADPLVQRAAFSQVAV